MEFVTISKQENVAEVVLCRGKVNALNEAVVEELKGCFQELKADPDTRAVILTGTGKFFSFGFDIPEFRSYSPEEFTRYLTKFADLYTYLFLYPKPVVAALNGHTIAGACMLATACDHRIMVEGKARISLNEVSFGSSVFAGSVEMLKACVGHACAERILLSGAMYSPEDALHLGLIHEVAREATLRDEALSIANNFAHADQQAFRSIKMLLRKPIAEQMVQREAASIKEFVEIWYSESTRKQTERIEIHS
jgi:enoyl-CoA hydratase/carnithine racemase